MGRTSDADTRRGQDPEECIGGALGVERNCSGSSDIDARVQMGQRTMYAMMGSGAYGSSSVAPMVIAHLWKVFALQRMFMDWRRIVYGLKMFSGWNSCSVL